MVDIASGTRSRCNYLLYLKPHSTLPLSPNHTESNDAAYIRIISQVIQSFNLNFKPKVLFCRMLDKDGTNFEAEEPEEISAYINSAATSFDRNPIFWKKLNISLNLEQGRTTGRIMSEK